MNDKYSYSEAFNDACFTEKSFVSPDEDARLKRLSISQLSTYRWSLGEELEALNAARVPAIGIWRPKFFEWGEEAAFHALRQSGVKVSSVSWAGGFTGSQGFSYNEAIQDSREAIHLAAKVNADCVMIATGARFGHTKNHVNRLVVDGLKQLSDYAKQFNVSLAVVPMAVAQARHWTYLTSLDQALDVVYHCNRNNVGLGIDLSLLSPEEDLLNRIEQVAVHTKMVRLNDSHSSQEHGLLSGCVPGDGVLPLDEIISRFNKHGYEGYFEFEIRSEKMWRQEDYSDLIHLCRDQFAQSVLV